MIFRKGSEQMDWIMMILVSIVTGLMILFGWAMLFAPRGKK